jgi:hypothetical protein
MAESLELYAPPSCPLCRAANMALPSDLTRLKVFENKLGCDRVIVAPPFALS